MIERVNALNCRFSSSSAWLAVLLMLAVPLAYAQTPASGTNAAPQSVPSEVPAEAADQTSAEPAGAAPVEVAGYGRVAFAEIVGPIDRMQARYVESVVDRARQADVDTLAVRIDTDGGQVLYAREIFKQILDLERDGVRTIAFVDYRAISAGALIAYAHQELLISETASIGDIGVVFRSAEGEIKYAPEKFETVIRTLLTQAAEQRGWSRGLLLKMTAHQQILYRVTETDGKVTYVIEDDLPEFLAKHPNIDKDDSKQVIVYRGKDRLLTLTGREAVSLGMATAHVNDLPALYDRLGASPETATDFAPNMAEQLAWFLARFSPILAGLAMLFLVFELKTPGIGLWATLAAIFGGAFLLAQYSLDMLENFEVVLMLLGITLIVLEVLLLATGGVLAIIGAAAAFSGLVLALVPNEFDYDLTDPAFVSALGDAALGAGIAVGIVAIGFFIAISYLPRTALRHRFAVETEILADSSGELEAREHELIGQRGTVVQMLRPSGLVSLAGETVGARAEHGAFVTDGQSVEVVAVDFGELLVRPVQAAEPVTDTGAVDSLRSGKETPRG